jgi:hypothetical protein
MSTPSHFEQKRADANEKYLGFAAQPAGGGVINILTGQDLQTGVVPSQASQIFQKRPMFTSNCSNCSKQVDLSMNLSGFKRADGTTDGTDWTSWLKSGLGAFSSYETNATAQAQADAAAAIEQAKAQQAAAAAQKQAATDAGVVSIVTTWTVPIIIIGVLGISGMAAYFYFKKKK